MTEQYAKDVHGILRAMGIPARVLCTGLAGEERYFSVVIPMRPVVGYIPIVRGIEQGQPHLEIDLVPERWAAGSRDVVSRMAQAKDIR